MVSGVKAINKILSNEPDKDIIANQMKGMKEVFQKSIVAANSIQKGEILKEHLAYKNREQDYQRPNTAKVFWVSKLKLKY